MWRINSWALAPPQLAASAEASSSTGVSRSSTRSRDTPALAVVLLNVIGNNLIDSAFPVPKVVTLVQNHQAVPAQVGQSVDHAGIGQNLVRWHPVLVEVVLPH